MENQSQTVMPVSKKIAPEQENELDYWSNEFGISKHELIEVVKAGGTPAEAVEKYVKQVEFAT